MKFKKIDKMKSSEEKQEQEEKTDIIEKQNTSGLGSQVQKKKRKNHKKKHIEKFVAPELPVFEVKEEKNSEEITDTDELERYYLEIAEKFNKSTAFVSKSEDETHEIQSEEEENIDVSGRMIRKYGRPTIAMLKLNCRRPELIEVNDTNAPDPFTLAELKNARNVVPVPSHWAQKRKYLNYKQGSEISKYRLPPYLEKTGIPQMRQAILEQDENRSQAAKQRERVRPKLGQLDVNPQTLYSAFYHQQTKPLMSRFGDLYFEGKENIPDTRAFRPGHLSQALRDALGMSENSPPPYLFAMQRKGPPPSYPTLKIPGLNAPIPKGCRYGSGKDGWGQVPIDPLTHAPLFGGNPFDVTEDDESEIEGAQIWGEYKRSENICDGVNI